MLAGLADLSEAVLLEFVNGGDEEPPAEVAVPVATSFGGASGQGTPRQASTPRRRLTTSIPRTPLSVSEAYEVAIAAQARSSQEREERREERREARLSLERYHSSGSGEPSQADPESPGRPMSPLSLGGGGWRSPAALMRRAFATTPRGSRDRSRSTEGEGRTPHAAVLSPTAGGAQAGGASGGGGAAFADLELVPLEAPKAAAADGGLPLPRAPRSQSSPATVMASSGGAAAASAGRGTAVTSPFQLAAQGAHGRPPLPPGTAAHGGSASSSPEGLPHGYPPVPPLQLGPSALPPPSPPSAAAGSPAPSPPLQSRDASPEKAGSGGSGGGSPAQLRGQPPRQPSLRGALPTIVSQQILGDEELPSLPPLNIPLHPMLSLREEALPLSAATRAAAGSPHSGSDVTPHGSAAAQQQGRPAAGKTVRISTDSGSGGEGRQDGTSLQRQSTTSTIFWMGEAGCVRRAGAGSWADALPGGPFVMA